MSFERILLGVFAVVFCAGAGICFSEPVIVVEPGELNFVALEGGSNPASQILDISNSGTGKLEWEITEDSAWLSVDPNNGSCVGETDEVLVSVDISGLTVGEYSCEIMITNSDASNGPQVVSVKLDVLGTILEVSPLEFGFAALEGGDNPERKILTIRNSGGGELNWEIEASSSCDWISIESMSGSLGPGEDEEIVLGVDISGLSGGEYVCELTISAPDAAESPQVVNIQLNILTEEEVLRVPNEYPTIQAAIDAAIEGDTIIVDKGTYVENINFSGKNITLTSIDPLDSEVVAATVIDGNNLDTVVTFEGSESAGCVLTGFTITNGLDNLEPAYGGGVKGNGCEATIRNCIITDNSAYRIVYIYDDNYGMYLEHYYGGGGGISGCNGRIEKCIISDNFGGQYGGGIYCDNSGAPTIVDCEIVKNLVKGKYDPHSGYYGHGGGIYGSFGPINNCIISNNEAGKYGGGVSQCCGPIVGCMIIKNKVGAMYPRGAVYYDYNDKTLEIRESIIADNIYVGGIYLRESKVRLIGSTIWDTLEVVYGGEAFVKNSILKNVYPDDSPYVYIEYSNVRGGWEGDGNIDADPEFVDPENGDYHLRWASPCVDSGDPAFIPAEGEVDIDGEPRVMGGRVDMGADEVGEKQADFTRDGRIDVSDLSVLSGSWGAQEGELRWYVLSDLFDDGVIDISDLAMFTSDWLWVADWQQ